MLKKCFKKISYFLPDELYLGIQYRYFTGKNLNLSNPLDFNEKLQWLKLNDRKPEYSDLVDKYTVRNYITKSIGRDYLIPIFAVYNSVDEINWELLPEKFVLKCTHGSGCNIICSNKDELDIVEAKEKLNKWMKINYYYHSREWPYKNVVPKIICEQFLEDDIYDYKFYCFNGKPKFLYVAQGGNVKSSIRMNFYDLDWNKCPFYREDHKDLVSEPEKPKNFDEMVSIATKLAKDFAFMRVDLFNVSKKLYFSELTFTPGGGMTPFSPEYYERLIGNWIKLPLKNPE